VLGALLFELVILVVLLLPLPTFLTKFVSGLLQKVFSSFSFGTWVVIVTFLLIDSSYNLYAYESRTAPVEHLAHLQFNAMRFRAQRNFYLTLFTFVVMLVIFRVRAIIAEFTKAKESLVTSPRPGSPKSPAKHVESPKKNE